MAVSTPALRIAGLLTVATLDLHPQPFSPATFIPAAALVEHAVFGQAGAGDVVDACVLSQVPCLVLLFNLVTAVATWRVLVHA